MIARPWAGRALAAALAAAALTAAPGGAAADDDDDRDPRQIAPLRGWTRGLYLGGYGGSIAGLSAGSFGLDLEVARGLGRWQLLGEASLHWVGVGAEPAPPGEPAPELDAPDGIRARLGAGARVIVRSFEPDHSAAIELYLEGGVGLERIWWNGGGTLTRPDVVLGGGWQVRGLRSPRVTIRMGARVIVQPPAGRDATTTVCRGTCPGSGQSGLDGGLLAHLGVSW